MLFSNPLNSTEPKLTRKAYTLILLLEWQKVDTWCSSHVGSGRCKFANEIPASLECPSEYGKKSTTGG